jgi:hypothetical protein
MGRLKIDSELHGFWTLQKRSGGGYRHFLLVLLCVNDDKQETKTEVYIIIFQGSGIRDLMHGASAKLLQYY